MMHLQPQLFQVQTLNKRRTHESDDNPVVMKRQRVQSVEDRDSVHFNPSPPTRQHRHHYHHQSHPTPLIKFEFGAGFGTVSPASGGSHSTPFSITPETSLESIPDENFTSKSGNVEPSTISSGVRRKTATPMKAKDSSSLPWWLQPPRRASPNPNAAGVKACYYCDEPHDDMACERCEHRLCDMCTRYCDMCSATWCPCCTVIDYDSSYERTLCFDCFNEEKAAKKEGRSPMEECVEDNVVLSWQ